jgi:hypothetical protein
MTQKCSGMCCIAAQSHPMADYYFRKTIKRGNITFVEGEYILGDPAYQSCPHCLVKYPKHKLCGLIHGPLPSGATCNCPEGRYPFERRFNWILDGVRGRVEKIIGQIVHHASFNNVKNRSHYNLLVAAVKLTLHTTAVWSRLYPQYPGYGDHPHDFS